MISSKMLQNQYSIAKVGAGAAENEPTSFRTLKRKKQEVGKSSPAASWLSAGATRSSMARSLRTASQAGAVCTVRRSAATLSSAPDASPTARSVLACAIRALDNPLDCKKSFFSPASVDARSFARSSAKTERTESILDVC